MSVKGLQSYWLTPHLNGEKLSTNSPRDIEYVLETLYEYWVDPDEKFCPESTKNQEALQLFFQKVVEIKIDATLSIKKTFCYF